MSTDLLIIILTIITVTIAAISGTMYFREVAKSGREQS